ncbi:MAG: hypothetical protein JXA33_24595 [Anaerolineae bacterium]|nr:hypothetical protein [Anaerolineae bacterium]
MSISALPRFGIFKTETRILHSEHVNQDYEIGTWLPFSYGSSERTYPVLFVPDGEFVYPAVMGLMPTHMGSGAVPEMIMVGIGYHGISTWEEFSDLRYRDFLPQCDLPHEKVSRLAQYTRFYQQELFPLIEREYRASDEDRAIFGFSCGGMEEEMMPGYRTVIETLQNGQYPEVRLNTRIFEGEGHSAGVIAKTFLDGLIQDRCNAFDFTFKN